MPTATEETIELPAAPVPAKIPLKKGQHTNATMRAVLAQKTRVALPNGSIVSVQSSGIVFNGQVITDPKELPTDEEIAAFNKETISRRS